MRRVPFSFVIVGVAMSVAIAFPAHGEEFAVDRACALLTRDLVMKIETPAGRELLESSEPGGLGRGLSLRNRNEQGGLHGPRQT